MSTNENLTTGTTCEPWCIFTPGHDQECQDLADIAWWNDGKHHPTTH